MSLDAHVYCDCYEKGKLSDPPPKGYSLELEEDGSLGYERDPNLIEYGFPWDEWRRCACEHTDGVLLHHRLGNISLIGLLRLELQREPNRFPILVTKVVYNGSHAGDYLTVEEVRALQRELELLGEFKCSTREAQGFMTVFREQMLELVAAAISINKPIVF